MVKRTLVMLIAILTLTTGAYAYDLSQYYYYDKVLEPSSILTYIHDDTGHTYFTESDKRPTLEEAQAWWKDKLEKKPEIKVLLTENQKHTNRLYKNCY